MNTNDSAIERSSPLPLAALLRLRPRKPAITKIRAVQREVCRFYSITLAELLSHKKPVRICWPRQVAMALCYEFGLGTMEAIVAAFKRNDHGTVTYAIDAVRTYTAFPALAAELDELRTILRKQLRVTQPPPQLATLNHAFKR